MREQGRYLDQRLLLPEMLAIVLERTRRLGERGKGAGQRMLGVAGRISWCWKGGGHEDHHARAMPARHKLPWNALMRGTDEDDLSIDQSLLKEHFVGVPQSEGNEESTVFADF